jgi:hypothetical protein
MSIFLLKDNKNSIPKVINLISNHGFNKANKEDFGKQPPNVEYFILNKNDKFHYITLVIYENMLCEVIYEEFLVIKNNKRQKPGMKLAECRKYGWAANNTILCRFEEEIEEVLNKI